METKHLLTRVIVWLLLLWGMPVLGMDQVIVQQCLNDRELSYQTVTAMATDDKQVIWTGTLNGLYSYDGKHYIPSPFSSGNDHITALVFNNNHFYTGTTNGLKIYAGKDKYRLKDHVLKDHTINDMLADKDHTIWFTTDNKLLAWVNKDSILDYNIPDNKPSGDILKIKQDHSNNDQMWVFHSSAIYTFNKKTGAFNEIPFSSFNLAPDIVVRNIKQDEVGNIWFLTANQLYQYNTHTSSINPILEVTDETFVNFHLTKNYQLLASTDQGHIYGYDILSSKPYNVQWQNPNHKNIILEFYEDDRNNLWLGANRNGLHTLNKKGNQFPYYDLHDPMKHYKEAHEIVSLWTDQDDNIMVGTKHKGLYAFNHTDGLFRKFAKQASDNPVVDYAYHNNTSWGIHENKLFTLDDQLSYQHVYVESKDSIRFQKVFYHADKLFIVYTTRNNALGILTYNPVNNTKEYFTFSSARNKPIKVVDTELDTDGAIWVATQTEGLYQLSFKSAEKRPQELKHRYSVKQYACEKELKAGAIHVLYVDESDVLWLGTNKGLIKFNRFEDTFKNYDFIAQLPYPKYAINNIVEDQNNHLWLTSSGAIIRFNTRNEKYDLFETDHHLSNPGFISSLNVKRKDGSVIFGHKQGITVFHPDNIIHTKYAPDPFVSQLTITTQDTTFNLNYPNIPSSLVIDKQAELTIQLGSVNYMQNKGTRFLYRIAQQHENWKRIPENNVLYLASMPPGDVLLEVKPSNHFGVRTDQPLQMTIHVQQKLPGYILIIIGLSILLVIATYLIFHHKKIIGRISRHNFISDSKTRGIDEKYHLKTLVDLLPDILYIKDRESRFVFGNKELAALMGIRNAEKLIGKTDFEYYDRTHAGEFFQDEQALMESGQAIINKTEYIQLDGQQDKWLLTSKIPIKNKNGAVIGLIGIGRDITLQKEAEEKLTEQTEQLKEVNTLLEEKQEEIRIQSEIIESEKNQLRTLVDNLPDVIYFKDTNTNFITGNAALVNTLKANSLEEVIGKNDYDYFDKELADAFYADDKKVLQTGKAIEWKEEKGYDKDGNEIIMNTTKIPIFDSDNNMIGMVGIGRNITSLKEAENKLLNQTEYLKEINTILEERQEEVRIQSESIEKERNQLRALIDNLPDLIYFKDTQARFVTANTAVIELVNANSPDELSGKTDMEFFPQEIAEQFYQDDMNILKTGKVLFNQEETIYDKEGQKRIISTTKVPIKDKEGIIIGLIGIGRDITNLKETEDQLRVQSQDLHEMNIMLEERQEEISVQSEKIELERNQLRTLIDNMPDLIYFKDTKARFITANKMIINVMKASSLENLIGKTDYDFYPKELAEKFYQDDLQVIESKNAIINQEEIGYDEDGKERYVSTTKVPIPDKEGNVIGLIGIGRDITKQKNAEQKLIKQSDYLTEVNQLLEERQEEVQQQSEELSAQAENLQQANTELERLNKTKDKFFSIIAHDLKNPFHAIMGFSELLTKEFTQMDDSQKLGLIDLINVSSESAFNLLENLLQWARTQTDKIKFNPEDIDLSELVNSNFQFHKVSALKKKINLVTKVSTSTMIHADANMINTVLRNLISNAIKFTDNGGKITVSSESKDEFVMIKVTDTGTGIDPETSEKLFRIDSYHTSIGTSGESGTGLGLIICKEFIVKHGGEINVDSKPGKGSTFYFTVPAEKS